MKKVLFYLIFSGLWFSCNHREFAVIPNNYVPTYTSEQLVERIRGYYISNFTDSLQNLLLEWNRLVLPSTDEYIHQNDTIANIYSIFTDLYSPFKFGDYNTLNYFEGKNRYAVIQNDINYAVVSSREYRYVVLNSSEGYPNDTTYEFYRKTHKLLQFRPKLDFTDIKPLYLTGEYKQAINDFLNLGNFQGDILNNDTILNRYKFLSPALPIVYGHWGGYWHLETFPIIDRVIFEDDFEHAAVDFRYGLEETVLQYRITKKSGHWVADNKWLKIRLE